MFHFRHAEAAAITISTSVEGTLSFSLLSRVHTLAPDPCRFQHVFLNSKSVYTVCPQPEYFSKGLSSARAFTWYSYQKAQVFAVLPLLRLVFVTSSVLCTSFQCSRATILTQSTQAKHTGVKSQTHLNQRVCSFDCAPLLLAPRRRVRFSVEPIPLPAACRDDLCVHAGPVLKQ